VPARIVPTAAPSDRPVIAAAVSVTRADLPAGHVWPAGPADARPGADARTGVPAL